MKDKDTLCSTLVHEVDRLRKLLMQLGVDPHKDNEDLSFEEAVSITENHQKVKSIKIANCYYYI